MTDLIARRLADKEAQIERSFADASLALLAIRDERLYRETHETFEDYCRQRWNMSRSRAYQVIGAAVTMQAMSTIVDTPLPTNEWQARELVGLDPEQAADVMRTAHESTGGRLTAAAIRAARAPEPPAVEPGAASDPSASEPAPTRPPVTEVDRPEPKAPAPREPEPKVAAALDDYLAKDDRLLRTNFAKTLAAELVKARGITLITPEQVAELADPDMLAEIDRLVADLTNWRNRIPTRGLSVIAGGRR